MSRIKTIKRNEVPLIEFGLKFLVAIFSGFVLMPTTRYASLNQKIKWNLKKICLFDNVPLNFHSKFQKGWLDNRDRLITSKIRKRKDRKRITLKNWISQYRHWNMSNCNMAIYLTVNWPNLTLPNHPSVHSSIPISLRGPTDHLTLFSYNLEIIIFQNCRSLGIIYFQNFKRILNKVCFIVYLQNFKQNKKFLLLLNFIFWILSFLQ